jgi:ATP-binding cassette subfamily B protein
VTSINQRAAASQTRINEFLKISPAIHNPTQVPFHLKGDISFTNVFYKYPNSEIEVLRDVSFTIQEGKTVAIIGKTGSGKSTILNLLMRQIDPNQGEINIDGKNLKTINLEYYRKQTGIVPQEVFLFSDTIANNIRFGSNEVDTNEEELEFYAKLAHVHHNIVDFPDQYDTLLGERGVNLSGGQKQRLSIARALIHKPRLLVLDDCLSAVDTETEDIILSNLKKLNPKPTTLIVSHRISSLRNADEIFVLDNGSIIEKGSHDQLIALKGIYADMYNKQLIDEKN